LSWKEIVWLPKKPAPVAVTVDPTKPLLGFNERDASTVNVAEPVFVPSEATIVWGPLATAGTVAVHEKLPEGPEAQDAEGAATPSSKNVIVRLARKPAPVTLVVLPTVPDTGLRESDPPMVNVAEAVLVPSDATIVWAP